MRGGLHFQPRSQLRRRRELVCGRRRDRARPVVILALPRLETRTRPDVWREWGVLTGREFGDTPAPIRVFDHYHMTIEAALNGLGIAIAPWHLVARDVTSGRLATPFAAVDSEYVYAVEVRRPERPRTRHFVSWLKEATQELRD